MNERITKRLIILSVFLSSVAVIGYEILAGSVLSNLLGSSIYYFSLIIGFFLAALGIGGWLSAKIKEGIYEKLVFVEVLIALVGGSISTVLFGAYAYFFSFFGNLKFPDIIAFLGGLAGAQLLFTAFSLFFISFVGVLAGFELPLYIRILSEKEILKDAIGRAFFWDYIGALIISVSLPIFFFANFGLIKTSFLIGIINILAAVFVLAASDIKKGKIILPIVFIAVFLVNMLGFINGESLELFFEKKQFGDREILYHINSPYQRLTFLKASDGKISLYINGQRQFESGDWDAVYHESFIHPAMSLALKHENILVLGGGDGLALREILKYPDVKKITLVDIDPAIISASSNLGFMKALNNSAFFDPKVNVVISDAFKFVEQQKKEKYDLVFVDFPDPTDDGLSHLYSKEFYVLLKSVLAENGVSVIQSEAYFGSVQKAILATLESAGLVGIPYHPPVYDFFDQNFGFSLVCMNSCSKNDFKNLAVSVPNIIFKNNKLSDIFSIEPISKYSMGEPEVNSIFHPTIFKLMGDVFAQHYLQSRPIADIFGQIKTSQEQTKNKFLKEFFITPDIAI